MALKAYRFVGLDEDVFLPDDIQVIIDIVPASMIGWVRSGVPVPLSVIDFSTFHDTGTPGATARSQRNYLHGGPKDEKGNRRKVGFNFAVDDKVIYQLTPLNEETWAAGTGAGNRTSWHVEQCFGGSINWDKSLRNAEALHAGLIHAIGDPVDTTLVKHQKWYGKWCPGQVLNRNIWSNVVATVSQMEASIESGGVTPEPPAPIYALPEPIPELAAISTKPGIAPASITASGATWFWVGDRVEATQDTPRLQRADSAAARLNADIKIGEQFDVDWITSYNGTLYYYTPWATRVQVAHTRRIADLKGEPTTDEGGN
jgi:hypothetical protein